MINEATRKILFAEIHSSIAEATNDAVAAFGSSESPAFAYPPGQTLTESEAAALRAMVLSPEGASAVYKLIAEACSYPMFHLFSLLDGVADPAECEEFWPGLALVPREDDAVPMYHDDFYETCPEPC